MTVYNVLMQNITPCCIAYVSIRHTPSDVAKVVLVTSSQVYFRSYKLTESQKLNGTNTTTLEAVAERLVERALASTGIKSAIRQPFLPFLENSFASQEEHQEQQNHQGDTMHTSTSNQGAHKGASP